MGLCWTVTLQNSKLNPLWKRLYGLLSALPRAPPLHVSHYLLRRAVTSCCVSSPLRPYSPNSSVCIRLHVSHPCVECGRNKQWTCDQQLWTETHFSLTTKTSPEPAIRRAQWGNCHCHSLLSLDQMHFRLDYLFSSRPCFLIERNNNRYLCPFCL